MMANNIILRNTSPSKKSYVVEKTLSTNLVSKIKNESLRWGILNTIILSILVFDIRSKCPYEHTKWLYVEYFAAIIIACSLFYNFSRYFYHLFSFEFIKCTEEQKKLLTFNEDDSFLTTPCENKSDDSISPRGLNHFSMNDSNATVTSPGWFFNKGSPHQGSFNQSYNINTSLNNSSLNTSNNKSFNSPSNRSPNTTGQFLSPYKYMNKKDSIIIDEKGLQNYLKNYESNEHDLMDGNDSQSLLGGQTINTVWNNYRLDDIATMLKTSIYQLSPTIQTSNKQLNKDDVNPFNNSLDENSDLLKTISSAKLSQYVANLRMWISRTILETLVREINICDASFKNRGFSDIQIGTVGLDRLKKTAENQQLVHLYVPMLPLVIPFLEMSTNQEYLVQRIKDLAKGSCIPDYRWDSGSTCNGITWDERLPTDSAILFHLVCSYIDSQLMPLPQPGGRPFYTRYVVIGDKKTTNEQLSEIKNKTNCGFLCINPMKPKFNFISDNKIHNSVYDRNNLFHVIIQFLIYIKTHHEGLLEGVNLGKNGINILCVIDD